MPTYQYACTECGHAFEQFQSFTDDALTECPQCQGRLRKLFNAVGVVFKGSGFYRNDSRASTGSSDGDSSKESSSTKESAPASSKETSPKQASTSSSPESGSSSSGSSGSASKASSGTG